MKSLAVLISTTVTCLLTLLPMGAQAACTFLMPLGGNGNGPTPYIVKKQVERPKGLIGSALGRTNWNTDFVVERPFGQFKLFFTADFTDEQPGT